MQRSDLNRENVLTQLLTGAWRVAVGLAVCCVLSATTLQGQVFAPNLPAEPERALGSLPTNAELQRTWTKVLARVERNDVPGVLSLVQAILDGPDDAFSTALSEEAGRPRGYKHAALHLLKSLPLEFRTAYENQYGALARQMLNEALSRGSLAEVGVVVRRFERTAAGEEALYLLASDCFDRRDWLGALRLIQQVRQTERAGAQFEPTLTLKAAACWAGLGRTERAVRVLTAAVRTHAGATVTLGERSVRLHDNVYELLSLIVPPAVQPGVDAGPVGPTRNWPQTGANPQRTGECLVEEPYFGDVWQTSSIEGSGESAQEDELITALIQSLKSKTQQAMAVPAAQPVVVGDTVIVRSFGNLRAYSWKTGEFLWTSADFDSAISEMLAPFLGQGRAATFNIQPVSVLLSQRAWSDTTVGTQSSDGARVYSIEDTGFGGWGLTPTGGQRWLAGEENRLAAYDLATGRLVWKIGAPRAAGDVPWAGAFFLGPPLAAAGDLYVLYETGGQIQAAAIDPLKGDQLWSVPVARLDPAAQSDPVRKMSGMSPSLAGKLLVCPSDCGGIVGIDLITHSLAWGHEFHGSDNVIRQNARPIPRNNSLFAAAPITGNEPNRWLDLNAVLTDEFAVLPLRRTNELVCLQLDDGTPRWTRGRGEALYIAGAWRDQVIVVERGQVVALHTDSGLPAWTDPPAIPAPAGRGFISQGRLYLPLSTAEIAAIDLEHGRLVSRTPCREGWQPGNLVATREVILSQTVDTIAGIKQLPLLESELAARLQANPDDVAALAIRAEVSVRRGRGEAALADLQRALSLEHRDPRVLQSLFKTIIQGLRLDFAAYRPLAPQIAAQPLEAADRLTLLQTLGAGLRRQGELAPACDVYWKILTERDLPPQILRPEEHLTISRPHFAAGQIEALRAEAQGPELAGLDALLSQRFAELEQTGPASELTKCLNLLPVPAAGSAREAVIVDLRKDGEWLREESALRQMQGSGLLTDGAYRARLVDLYLAAHQPADAAILIEELARLPFDEKVWKDRTAAEAAADWLKQADVREAVERLRPLPLGPVNVEVQPASGHVRLPYSKVQIVGNDTAPPAFTLEIDDGGRACVARDLTDQVLWKIPVSELPPGGSAQANRAFVRGHLVLLALGQSLLAVDTLGTPASPRARILWQANLNDVAADTTTGTLVRERTGRDAADARNRSGEISVAADRWVCYLQGSRLTVADSLTGEVAWQRTEIPAGCGLTCDKDHVILFSGQDMRVLAFALGDGHMLSSSMWPPGTLLNASGRIFLMGVEHQAEHVTAWDAAQNKELWRRRFAHGSRGASAGAQQYLVAEPTGRLHLLDTVTGETRWSHAGKPIPSVKEVWVRRRREGYVILVGLPLAGERDVLLGFQHLPFRGWVYGLDTAGREQWPPVFIERQAFDATQPAAMPILCFSCMSQVKKGLNSIQTQFDVLCLDQRTGKIVFQHRADTPVLNLQPVLDPQAGSIQLRFPDSLRTIRFGEPRPRPDGS